MKFKQCLLTRKDSQTTESYVTSWLPEKFAHKEKRLKLKDNRPGWPGDWSGNWIVKKVYGDYDIEDAESPTLQQVSKKHRKRTDI
jgi:hypothetical protein